jgi:hypothetical protein
MSAELAESIERDTRAMERIAAAFERIADQLAQFYEKMYPPKHDPGDVTLTKLKGPVDLIKEAQGAAPEETTEEWLDIGPREREFDERSKNPQPRRPSRFEKKASGLGASKGKS